MGESIRIWLGVPSYNMFKKEHHMKALVWPMLAGLLIGLAIATVVVYRLPLSNRLQSANKTPVEPFQGSFLKRPSLEQD